MRIRFFIVVGIMALLHVYIGFQLIPYLPEYHGLHLLAILILLFSLLVIPLGMSARFIIKDHGLSDLVTWIGMIDMGLFSTLLILTFARQLLLKFYEFFYGMSTYINMLSTDFVILLAFLLTLVGLVNARRTAKVSKVDIAIKNLPHELEGFAIAQISDIHVGPTIKYKYLSSIVKTVNQLKVDMVAITGDLVDGSVVKLSRHTQALADLDSSYGSFFVLGNHEYYSGADSWVAEIRSLGLTVLLNQHVVLKHNGAPLVIAGITDYSGEHFGLEHKSDPVAAIKGAPEQAIKILLAHQPRSAKAAEKFGFALQLSGHTHGGQFWPWNLFIRLQQPFTAGLGKVNNMWVYTNRGTGYWGPPKRLGIPSEITHLRLVRAY